MRKMKGIALLTMMSMLLTSVPIETKSAVEAENKVYSSEREKDGESSSREEDVASLMDSMTTEDYVEGEVVVTYKNIDGVDVGELIDKVNSTTIDEIYEFENEQMKTSSGGKARKSVKKEEFFVTTVKSKKYSTEELMNKISAIDGVICVEPNYVMQIESYNDDYYDMQWALENNYNTNDESAYDMNFESAQNIESSGEEKVIAIVDTGVDYTHEDLKNKMWINPYEQSELEGIYGYDFCNVDNDPIDDHGHGTHCAGVIAAEENNAIGIVGLASRINIKIMAIKVFDANGKGTLETVVSAYNYIYKAQCLGTDIVAINNSWSGSKDVETLDTLIETVGNNGALTVCSAGNSSMDIDETQLVPSKYNSDYIITVAACDETGKLASFSNYGKKNVDIAAPGENILSTVSYNSFIPWVYKNPEDVCQIYNGFDSETYKVKVSDDIYSNRVVIGDIEELGLTNHGSGKVTIGNGYPINSLGRENNNPSLVWTVENAIRLDEYFLVIPYTVSVSDTPIYRSVSIKMKEVQASAYYATYCRVYDVTIPDNGIYYLDYDDQLGMKYCDERENWTIYSDKVSDATEEDINRALVIRLQIGSPGDYEVYIDNFGVSKENLSEESFGKYDYMSGTSMACPCVTAAVALASEKYPEDSALEIKNKIMTSVQFDDSLKDIIATGGRIDLDKLGAPENVVTNLEFTDDKIIKITGYNLEKVQVRLDGIEREVISQTYNEIQVDASELINKKVKVELLKNNEIEYSDYCSYLVVNEPEYCGEIQGTINTDNIVSDGNALWCFNNEKDVYKGIPVTENGEKTIEWRNCNVFYGLERINSKTFGYENMDESEMEYYYSDIICNNDALYVIGRSYYSIYDNEIKEYISEYRFRLLKFDIKNGWKAVANLEEDKVGFSLFSLFAYNNNIYIIGGAHQYMYNFLPDVYKYVESNNKDMGSIIVADDIPKLPEERGDVTGVQVGNKLILTLGTTGKRECPHNLIFDGKEWIVSKVNPEIENYISMLYGKSYVYKANVGIVEDGIIYTGTESKYHGNIFKYNVEKDEFECMEYGTSFDEEIYENVVASTVGDKLYLLADSSADEESFELYKIPVECGYLYVEDSSEENGYIEGANRYYLWSEMISLCGKAEDDCYLYSLSVNGQIIEGKGGEVSFTGLASDYYKTGMVVNGQFGEYVTDAYLRDYYLIVLKPGESVSVKCAILPTNAYNKKVYFECDMEGLIIQDGNVICMSEDAELEMLYLVNIVSADRDETVGSFFVVCSEEYYTVPRLSSWIYIDGYQISTKAEGVRVLYSVDKSNEDIESFGLVYGLADYCTEADLIVDSPNSTVYSFEATPAGKNVMSDTTNHTFEDYVMTMKFIDSAKFYDSEIMVTAYLKNKDGTYEYTEVKTFSVYDIADYLYTKQLMTSYERHCYLFDNILSVVNDTYSPIEYNWINTIAR